MTQPSDAQADARPVFGTVSLYDALAVSLNADPEWRVLAAPLTYTMVYEYQEPIGKCFLLRFAAGEVAEVAELASPSERGPVDFVITAKPEVWAKLIKQELQPTAAMATGRVKVRGKQAVLLRHMKRFNYLINRLCNMDPVFPEAR